MSSRSFRRAGAHASGSIVTLLVVLAPLLAVVGACGDDKGGFASVDPADISIFPRVISFNQIPIGDTETANVTVENNGGGELIITEWNWVGAADDFIVDGLTDLRVPGGEQRIFTITYAPLDEALDEATLVIDTNAGQVDIAVTSLGQAGVLRADPEVVNLVSDTVGLLVEESVTIFNAGTEPFLITNVSLVTGSTEFQMAPDFGVPLEVGLDDRAEVTIAYNPSGRGADEAVLLIEHDAANAIDGFTQVPVTGSVLSPFLILDPDFVGFEAVPLGETRTETVAVGNEGETTLRVTDLYMDFGSSDEMSIVSFAVVDFVEGAVETVAIEPGEIQPLVVSYTPADNEPDNATVMIVSNDPDFPIMPLPMGGRLAAPYLSVTPEVLAFGSVASGLVRTMSVIIRNAGSEPLELDSPTVSGDGSFTLPNADLVPSELEPDQSFELLVDFAPLSEGTIEADLTITSPNDPDHSPAIVLLHGFGGGEPVCDITVTPTTINFGLVPRGSARAGRAAVRNSGSGNCRINQVFMTPPPFPPIGPFGDLFSDAFSLVSVSIPAGTTLGPGESFVIEAQYAPTSFTVFSETPFGDTGSVTIDVTDPFDTGRTVECGNLALFSFAPFVRDCGINLQGMSGVAELAAIPSEVDFGLVTRGCNSQTITVNLYNIGSAPVTISSIGLEDCTPEFALAGVPPEVSGPDGYMLASGSPPLALQVRYAPTTLGPSTCNLVIESDAETASRLVVPLTGEGTDSSEQIDHFEQVSGREVDVLFVVDNSASMSEEQENLATNFSSFIAAAATWENDFQIGIITVESDEEFAGRQPGELVGDPRILVPETPNLQAEFSDHAEVGDAGDGARESGLEAAWLALSDPIISDVGICGADCTAPYSCVPNARGTESRCGGYNRSFLREDASLEIVFLSDEEDQSRGTVDFYIDFFQSIKGERNRALFHASSIVGPRGGCATADAGDRYLDVADTTGGVTGSICDSDFATSLANIGNRAFGLRVQFFLSRVAEPGTVVVTDDSGSPLGGWTYDETSNSVVFTEETAPLPGEEFDASYTARCF